MDTDSLRQLLREPEGQHLEFKAKWYDLGSRRGKAEFAKDVIAMANGLAEGEVGHIVLGRDDPDRGGACIGVPEDIPSYEQVVEILGSHSRPSPSIWLHQRISVDDCDFSVIEVAWSRFHPHYSTRDVDQVLSTERVLVREGSITRGLTPPELETLIRAKDARIGQLVTGGPLEVGFVQLPGISGGEGAVRVRNTSEEPVEGVSAVLDVERVFPQGFSYRMPLVTGLTVPPGETRELQFRPSTAHFYRMDGSPLDDDSKIWSRWVDLVLHLTYRDRSGILVPVEVKVAIGGY